MKLTIIRYGACTLALLIASTTVPSAASAGELPPLEEVSFSFHTIGSSAGPTTGRRFHKPYLITKPVSSTGGTQTYHDDDEDLWDLLGSGVQGGDDDGWWMLDFETGRR